METMSSFINQDKIWEDTVPFLIMHIYLVFFNNGEWFH